MIVSFALNVFLQSKHCNDESGTYTSYIKTVMNSNNQYANKKLRKTDRSIACSGSFNPLIVLSMISIFWNITHIIGNLNKK